MVNFMCFLCVLRRKNIFFLVNIPRQNKSWKFVGSFRQQVTAERERHKAEEFIQELAESGIVLGENHG